MYFIDIYKLCITILCGISYGPAGRNLQIDIIQLKKNHK